MIKWFKARSRQEKWMIILLVVSIIAVIMRWGYIKQEAGAAFRQRIDHFKAPQGQIDSMLDNSVSSEE
jgi:hypothetical protein